MYSRKRQYSEAKSNFRESNTYSLFILETICVRNSHMYKGQYVREKRFLFDYSSRGRVEVCGI